MSDAPADGDFAWARGRRLLATFGRLREDLDGVRCIAAPQRLSLHALDLLDALAAAGADLLALGPPPSKATPARPRSYARHTVAGRPILSSEDLAYACASASGEGTWDAILHLADCPSLRPARPVAHKIKAKGAEDPEFALEVVGTTDPVEVLLAGSAAPLIGMDRFGGQMVRGGIDPALRAAVFGRGPGVGVSLPSAGTPGQIQDLAGLRVVVSNGPTEEVVTPWGDVVTNFSSGRQGMEIAWALADRGARVDVVMGPCVAVAEHPGVALWGVRSAEEMWAACLNRLPADAFVGVAAVADFAAQAPCAVRLAPGEAALVRMRRNPDILAAIGQSGPLRPKTVVGFAAETRDLVGYARGKLTAKDCDAVIANLVGPAASERRTGATHALVIWADREEDLGTTSKREVGQRVAEILCTRR